MNGETVQTVDDNGRLIADANPWARRVLSDFEAFSNINDDIKDWFEDLDGCVLNVFLEGHYCSEKFIDFDTTIVRSWYYSCEFRQWGFIFRLITLKVTL